MSGTTVREALEKKVWKPLNLQMDTMLKIEQTRSEVWKVVAAGGALVAGTAALFKIFSP